MIFWDFDGTLGFRAGGWTGAMLDVMRRHGAKADDEAAERLRPHLQAGFPWHDPRTPHPQLANAEAWWAALEPVLLKAFIGAGVPQTDAEIMAGEVRDEYLRANAWSLYEDTLPMLRAIRGKGIAQAILTNHVPEFPDLARTLGLAGLVNEIFNSAETGYEKPHPEAFRLALGMMGEPGAAWMVGNDYAADYEGAEAAGLKAVLVRAADRRAKRRAGDLLTVWDRIQ